MKTKKYLKFYEQCMEAGFLPHKVSDNTVNGLCGNLGRKAMELFEPTLDDCSKYDVKTYGYWGRDGLWRQYDHFGPTRQTIVLFLAAMNGEL